MTALSTKDTEEGCYLREIKKISYPIFKSDAIRGARTFVHVFVQNFFLLRTFLTPKNRRNGFFAKFRMNIFGAFPLEHV